MTNTTSDERYSRQETIVEMSKVQEAHPVIVGCGAVGFTVGEILVRNGFKKITIFDFDEVEEHNCVTQGFVHSDIGKSKVSCFADYALKINPEVTIIEVNSRFSKPLMNKVVKEHGEFTALFNCVDSLDGRSFIYNAVKKQYDIPIVLDARLSGEAMVLFTAHDEESFKYYGNSFTSDKTAAHDGCHIPMVRHSAMTASAQLVQQYISSLKHGDLFLHTHRAFTLMDGVIQDLTKPNE